MEGRARRSWHVAMALVGSAAAVLLGGERARDTAWKVEGSPGPEGPALAALLGVAAEARAAALGRLAAEVGPAPGELPIDWVLDARLDASRSRAEGARRVGATSLREGRVVVVIPLRSLLRRPDLLPPVVHHEAVHAVWLSRLGGEARYASIPRWFREGAASVFADEVTLQAADATVVSLLRDDDPRAFLLGEKALRSRTSEESLALTHAEAALLAASLKARLQESGWRALIAEVLSGKDLDSALGELLGATAAVWAPALAREARELLDRAVPGEDARALQALLALRRGEAAPGVFEASARRFLRERAESPLAPSVRYLLARRLLEMDGDALSALPLLVAGVTGDRSLLWRPEMLLLLGACQARLGDTDAARAALTELLEAFADEERLCERARELLETLGPRGPRSAPEG